MGETINIPAATPSTYPPAYDPRIYPPPYLGPQTSDASTQAQLSLAGSLFAAQARPAGRTARPEPPGPPPSINDPSGRGITQSGRFYGPRPFREIPTKEFPYGRSKPFPSNRPTTNEPLSQQELVNSMQNLSLQPDFWTGERMPVDIRGGVAVRRWGRSYDGRPSSDFFMDDRGKEHLYADRGSSSGSFSAPFFMDDRPRQDLTGLD